jgi:hypothetical protein
MDWKGLRAGARSMILLAEKVRSPVEADAPERALVAATE